MGLVYPETSFSIMVVSKYLCRIMLVSKEQNVFDFIGIARFFIIKRKSRETFEPISRCSNFHGQLLMSAMLLVVAIILRFCLI